MLAGADTTAIIMKAITYNVLAHPSVFETLRAKLDAAKLNFPPSYEQTQELHYLNAVITEVSTAYSVFFAIQHVHILRILANGGTSQGMRMHPVIGDILERVVPDGGLTLPDGRVIAPGTKVGINPWV